MKQMIIFLVALALISGCLQQPYSENMNGNNTVTLPTQQYAQNDSSGANATGDGTIEPVENQSNGNGQIVPDGNTTIIPDDPQQEILVHTNKSLDQLLSDGLDKLPGPNESGPFFISSNTWKTNEYDNDPGSINIVFNPTNMVLFDNKSDENLVGFAFKTYKPNTGKTTSNGLMIVYGASALLDNHMAFDPVFDIDYTGIGQPKKLSKAQITSREELFDNKERKLTVYVFDYAQLD
jgi:hypothetical protein